MRSSSPVISAATALVVSVLLTGCSHAAYWGYMFAPNPPSDTRDAECDALPGRTVVIVIYTDESVQYEYPTARAELSAALSEELKKRVEGVSVVNWRRVIKYQDSNLDWAAVDKAKLGKLFNADFVLYISLSEFALREPGSLNLYRGRITANVSLHETYPTEPRPWLWRGDDIRVVYPEKGHDELFESAREIRELSYNTVKAFADELAKRFYKHEVPKGP